MNQENQQIAAENNAEEQEQIATNAVAYSDALVAEQATGYATNTPEEAEQVARSAVEAAANPTEWQTPQAAEQEAAQAVEATEH